MYVHKYTDEEIAYLKDNIYGTPLETLVNMFNNRFNTSLNLNQIKNICYRLKLKNTLKGHRIRGRIKTTRFCHDCGKPTNNSRCTTCWEEIRSKINGIWEKDMF